MLKKNCIFGIHSGVLEIVVFCCFFFCLFSLSYFSNSVSVGWSICIWSKDLSDQVWSIFWPSLVNFLTKFGQNAFCGSCENVIHMLTITTGCDPDWYICITLRKFIARVFWPSLVKIKLAVFLGMFCHVGPRSLLTKRKTDLIYSQQMISNKFVLTS